MTFEEWWKCFEWEGIDDMDRKSVAESAWMAARECPNCRGEGYEPAGYPDYTDQKSCGRCGGSGKWIG